MYTSYVIYYVACMFRECQSHVTLCLPTKLINSKIKKAREYDLSRTNIRIIPLNTRE